MVMQLLPPSISTTFSSSQTETPHSLSNSSLFSLPPGSGNHSSVSMNVMTLGNSYKWNLSFCAPLISLSMMSSSFIPTVAHVRISFLLRLNDIPLCIYHILCIYSSTDGYLGCHCGYCCHEHGYYTAILVYYIVSSLVFFFIFG